MIWRVLLGEQILVGSAEDINAIQRNSVSLKNSECISPTLCSALSPTSPAPPPVAILIILQAQLNAISVFSAIGKGLH